MKKGLAMVVAAVAVAQATSMGVAFAGTGYDSSSDTSIGVFGAPSSSSGFSTGNLTFELQESVYRTLGLSVPHDYLWVNAFGVSLLAVDPPKPMI